MRSMDLSTEMMVSELGILLYSHYIKLLLCIHGEWCDVAECNLCLVILQERLVLWRGASLKIRYFI